MDRTRIARTIIDQLGGGRFQVMTGAKNFMALDSGLSFKLPSSFAVNGINYVRVTLTPMDDYTVEFMRVRGLKVTTVNTREGVYCDVLAEVFERVTGLRTRL